MKAPLTRRQMLMLAVATFVLDQLSKYWLIELVGMKSRPPIQLNEYFAVVMAWNKGVSFSMFTHSAAWMPYVLALMAVVICAGLAHLAHRSKVRLEGIGYALIIGGALSNAFDRLRFGAVADFFYAHIGDLGWPAFNVADMTICLGVGLLLFSLFKHRAPA